LCMGAIVASGHMIQAVSVIAPASVESQSS
jgi:hypothetical protein